jgi:hypothetical protein
MAGLRCLLRWSPMALFANLLQEAGVEQMKEEQKLTWVIQSRDHGWRNLGRCYMNLSSSNNGLTPLHHLSPHLPCLLPMPSSTSSSHGLLLPLASPCSRNGENQ